jgi:endonuclease/exonuclease/phosphatase (EEP) superfamily protein YafD
MFKRIFRGLLLMISIAVMAVCLWPQLVGLSRTSPLAFVVVSRGATTIVAVICIVVMLLLGILGRRVRRALRLIIVWFSVLAGASALMVYNAGWSDTSATSHDNSLVIFSWNTMGAKAGSTNIAKLALDVQADVVTLPETTVDIGNEVAAAFSAAGKPMTVLSQKFDDIYKAHSTTVLISKALGEYRLDTSIGDTGTSPSLVAVPARQTSPTIVAAHVVAPDAAKLENWRTDLKWLATRCTQPNVIMAGDFNASIDNVSGLGPAPMGNCGDVGLKLGGASIGTWPQSLPPLLGTQIDHVFYSAEWKPVGFRVVTSVSAGASDHRPIVATIVPVTK